MWRTRNMPCFFFLFFLFDYYLFWNSRLCLAIFFSKIVHSAKLPSCSFISNQNKFILLVRKLGKNWKTQQKLYWKQIFWRRNWYHLRLCGSSLSPKVAHYFLLIVYLPHFCRHMKFLLSFEIPSKFCFFAFWCLSSLCFMLSNFWIVHDREH